MTERPGQLPTQPAPASRIVALRTIGAVLIELPFAFPPKEQPWAASLWPAPGGGWGREVWLYDARRRGWVIPSSCHHGTIVELATATRRRRRLVTARAWYGVAVTHDSDWLVCASATSDPNVAAQHASDLTDEHRLAVIERHQ